MKNGLVRLIRMGKSISQMWVKMSCPVLCSYRNDPKFSDRYAWANSVDPVRLLYTVCHSVCIIWTHCSMVEPHSSNFRVITANFLGVRIFRKFTVVSRISFQCRMYKLLERSNTRKNIYSRSLRQKAKISPK